MNLTEDEKAAIISLFQRSTRDEYPQPNFTAAEVAELLGITRDQAYQRLEAKVALKQIGKATDVQVSESIHGVNLYWRL